MKKRIFSFLVAVAMIFGFMLSVSAENIPADNINIAGGDETLDKTK